MGAEQGTGGCRDCGVALAEVRQDGPRQHRPARHSARPACASPRWRRVQRAARAEERAAPAPAALGSAEGRSCRLRGSLVHCTCTALYTARLPGSLAALVCLPLEPHPQGPLPLESAVALLEGREREHVCRVGSRGLPLESTRALALPSFLSTSLSLSLSLSVSLSISLSLTVSLSLSPSLSARAGGEGQRTQLAAGCRHRRRRCTRFTAVDARRCTA